jgi:hypothetical protein
MCLENELIQLTVFKKDRHIAKSITLKNNNWSTLALPIRVISQNLLRIPVVKQALFYEILFCIIL